MIRLRLHTMGQSIPIRSIILSILSSIQPTSSLIGHLEPLLHRQPWSVLPNSPADIHPTTPPPCLSNLINLILVPSSHLHPSVLSSIHCKQETYSIWSETEWILRGWQLDQAHYTTVSFPLSLSFLALSIRLLQHLHDKEWYELHQPCRWVPLPLP